MPNTIRTVLFDLDGTLADTAPDLAWALNRVLQEQGGEPLPFEQIRPVVSHGGMALIRLAFAIDDKDARFEPLRQRLLALYSSFGVQIDRYPPINHRQSCSSCSVNASS
jgi:N-acetyl-D-muramate 6-phosphate phosphatase